MYEKCIIIIVLVQCNDTVRVYVIGIALRRVGVSLAQTGICEHSIEWTPGEGAYIYSVIIVVSGQIIIILLQLLSLTKPHITTLMATHTQHWHWRLCSLNALLSNFSSLLASLNENLHTYHCYHITVVLQHSNKSGFQDIEKHNNRSDLLIVYWQCINKACIIIHLNRFLNWFIWKRLKGYSNEKHGECYELM